MKILKCLPLISTVFFIMCLLHANGVTAQVPTYTTTAGTTNNSFPFGAGVGGNSKVQWLYTPAQFTSVLPTGQITKIWFRTYNGASLPTGGTYGNFTIKIGMTSLTNLPTTGLPYAPGPVLAYGNVSQAIPAMGINTWFSFTLQTPIPYTTGNNFIVELEHSGYSSSTWYASCIAPTYVSRAYGTYGSTVVGASSTASCGEIGLEIQTGPPCPAPTGLNVTNILSASATVGWTPVAGSLGYEYIVDQNALVPFPNTPIATATTTANVTGLTPATNYYLHVRNLCSPTNPSPWVDFPFTTLPPCKPPIGFKVTNLTPISATINWNVWLSALTYDYIIDQTSSDPTSSTGVLNTALTSVPVTGLTENTWYYVHTRSRCAGSEISNWGLDSFLTPIVCLAPEIKIDHISVDEGVAYWSPVNTAFEYEYAITKSATPPTVGTKYSFTSIHTSALEDGIDYYVHVRAHCKSVGVTSASPWSTTSFKTFPLSAANLNEAALSLTVFPNPVKDRMYVQLNGNSDSKAVVLLTDVTGRSIIQQIALVNNNAEVDMKGLTPGVYLLKYSDGIHTKTIKVNKQ
jgi:hypothetical protein